MNAQQKKDFMRVIGVCIAGVTAVLLIPFFFSVMTGL